MYLFGLGQVVYAFIEFCGQKILRTGKIYIKTHRFQYFHFATLNACNHLLKCLRRVHLTNNSSILGYA